MEWKEFGIEQVANLCGAKGNAVLTRWLNRVQTLEDKKYDYEVILKQRLDDMDSEFEYLKTLCSEYRLRVNTKYRNAA